MSNNGLNHSPISLDEWIIQTRKLLIQERDEEILQIKGELETLKDHENPNVLSNVELVETTSGLFGRTLLKFTYPSNHLQRPKAHNFSTGDLIQLRMDGKIDNLPENKSSVSSIHLKFPTGIVARVTDDYISVAMDPDTFDSESLVTTKRLTLDRLVNNATFDKLTKTLDYLQKEDFGAAQRLKRIMFYGEAPTWQTPILALDRPFNTELNSSQCHAIAFALASKDIALIHGPPGTGKTTTVVELIRQAVRVHGLRVLVCAPSNIAVDNVLEKLVEQEKAFPVDKSTTQNLQHSESLSLIRIGHPAKVTPAISSYCFDALVQKAEETEIVNDVKQELQAMVTQLNSSKLRKDRAARSSILQKIKENRKEIRERERKVVGNLLQRANIVFSTTVGASSRLLHQQNTTTGSHHTRSMFDLVIIDEAAQAYEIECWLPIRMADRCILAGDHKQLPPTIKSKRSKSEKFGLDLTMFDRLTQMPIAKPAVQLLDVQYRMHHIISDWCSNAMYEGKLNSFEGVAQRKLQDLSMVNSSLDETGNCNATMLLIDTTGCVDCEERDSDISKSNVGEAAIVVAHVKALLNVGLLPHQVAIISPYNGQVALIKEMLKQVDLDKPGLEIRSVDGFQGCEKEAIVLSLVRSNEKNIVGFLADDRRLNVAVTRAKRHVAVVCNSETIVSHLFLKNLIEYIEENGEVCSGEDYVSDAIVVGDERDFVSNLSVNMPPNESKIPPASTAVSKTIEYTPPKPKTQQKKTKEKNEKTHIAQDSQQNTTINLNESEGSASGRNLIIEEVEITSVPNAFSSVLDISLSSESDTESTLVNEVMTDMTKMNIELRDLHLSRLARQKALEGVQSQSTQTSKSKKKKKGKSNIKGSNVMNKSQKSSVLKSEDTEMDDMSFLEQAAKANSICAYDSCKKSIVTFGQLCKFCKVKYCFPHMQAEVHGCTADIRSSERSQFLKITGNGPKRSKEQERVRILTAKKNLHKKLETKAAARQTNVKKKE